MSIAIDDEPTTRYPFDVAHLRKGSTIPAEVIERAYGIARTDERYRVHAQLRARHYVDGWFLEGGVEVVVRCKGPDLVVLTDEQAVVFTDDTFANLVERMRVTLRKQNGVDVAELRDVTARIHERALRLNSAQYVGGKLARREALAPSRRERATPGRLRGE